MYILGINAFHGDSSACLIKDGVVVCATEEERIRRIKHWAGFPSEAIKFCLREANIDITQVVWWDETHPKCKIGQDYINNKNVSFNSEIEISDDSIFITSF